MATPKRIFILLGNPVTESFSGHLTDVYETAAREAGHEVRRMNIADMHFDPILHKGYREIQPLEPDLITVQENITWCNHVVIVYPVWWSAMPALLKGMFDRMWLPCFAYKFSPKGVFWRRLLKGRSGRIIVMMDTYPLILRLAFGDHINAFKRAILAFAGIAPIRTLEIGHAKFMTSTRAARYKRKVAYYGRRGV